MRQHPRRQARGHPRRRRIRHALALLLIACAFSALLPTSALAATRADSGPAIHPVVAAYASDYSVTPDEAKQRLERIPALQDVIASLHSLEAVRLAGWDIDHHGPMTAWIWLTGSEPPSRAAAELAHAHSDVQIRTGAEVTFAALSAAQAELSVGEHVGPVGSTGATGSADAALSDLITHTSVDLRANALEIGIDTNSAQIRSLGPVGSVEREGPFGPAGSTGAAQSAADTLAVITSLLAPHITVPYNVIESRPFEDHADFEGGRRMTQGDPVCTSGFTAYHRGENRYGLITAGHCNASTWTTQGATLEFKVRAHDAGNDAAFYVIPKGQGHSATNRIRCSDNSGVAQTCPIQSIGPSRLFMMGHYVCHMGTNSGVSCGTVDSVAHQPNPDNGCDGSGTKCAPVFVRASGLDMRVCLGDSGGPVYSHNAAYGILKGAPKGNPCDRSNSFIVFSGIRRVQAALGVAVVTGWRSDTP